MAAKLIGYRSDDGLSQRGLADVLGVKQPQTARWKSGGSLPSTDNPALIAGALDIEIVLSSVRADREPKQTVAGAAGG